MPMPTGRRVQVKCQHGYMFEELPGAVGGMFAMPPIRGLFFFFFFFQDLPPGHGSIFLWT